jgi:hypothetical protein
MPKVIAVLIACLFLVACSCTRISEQTVFENHHGLSNRGIGIEYYTNCNYPKLPNMRRYLYNKLKEEDILKHNEKYSYFKVKYNRNGYPEKMQEYFHGNELAKEWFFEYAESGNLRKVVFRHKEDNPKGGIIWIVDIYNDPSDEKTK